MRASPQYRFDGGAGTQSGDMLANAHKRPRSQKRPDFGVAQILSMSSDDSKPYMIWKALDETFQNHIGFAIIRARGKDLSHGKHGLRCGGVFAAEAVPL